MRLEPPLLFGGSSGGLSGKSSSEGAYDAARAGSFKEFRGFDPRRADRCNLAASWKRALS